MPRWGLAFVHLRTANYHSERLEGVRQLQGEYWLLVSEAEAKLHGRQRLADVLSAQEVQAVAEAVRKVALHRERVRVWAHLLPPGRCSCSRRPDGTRSMSWVASQQRDHP